MWIKAKQSDIQREDSEQEIVITLNGKTHSVSSFGCYPCFVKNSSFKCKNVLLKI